MGRSGDAVVISVRKENNRAWDHLVLFVATALVRNVMEHGNLRCLSLCEFASTNASVSAYCNRWYRRCLLCRIQEQLLV